MQISELVLNSNINKAVFSKISKPALFILLGILTSFIPKISYAQFSSVSQAKEFCIKALKNNNVDDLIKAFSDPVEITLPQEENSYSKTQGAMVIKRFFKNNAIKSFTVKQGGKSTGGSEFVIGDMISTSGKKFQVYFLITLTNQKAYLHLIEFEET